MIWLALALLAASLLLLGHYLQQALTPPRPKREVRFTVRTSGWQGDGIGCDHRL